MAMTETDHLAAVADWLVATGYPFDWSSEVVPPQVLQAAIEDGWVRKDGPEDADAIRVFCAEEGGWLDAFEAREGRSDG